MPITGLLGYQRGDEGKGRYIDMLAPEFDIVARFNGGNNAGHTVVLPDDKVLKLSLVPSGIAYEHTKNVIGNGTLVNPKKLTEEIDYLKGEGISVSPENLLISSAAHLILPGQISEDEIRECGSNAQGSTKSGIAQAASSKSMRQNLRLEIINNDIDKLAKEVKAGLVAQRALRKRLKLSTINVKEVTEQYVDSALRLGEFITDTTLFLGKELRKQNPARVLAEGAQAFLLDIDHGMYPMTTSSNTTSGGIATGLGVSPKYIDRIIGVAKLIPSHVGDGPFVTQFKDSRTSSRIHGDLTSQDAEKGTVTGRVRRLGHLDIPALKRAQMVNGGDELFVTKLDWLNRYEGEIPVCVSYSRKDKDLDIAPDAAYKLEQSTPRYEILEGWEDDISDVRYFEDLPSAAQKYIEFIEEKLEIPVTNIGVGQGREQVIIRNRSKPR